MRPSKRKNNELRTVEIIPRFNPYAEGSCLIKVGNTHVICTASVEERVPMFLRNSGKGWVTAEYGMLPRSTDKRIDREAARGAQSGRTKEIQRLIGRSLRSIVDFSKLGERQIRIDCDVVQADGGTRTASITGGFVALYMACQKLVEGKKIKELPICDFIAAISCGIHNENTVMDLDYQEDSSAQADANFVLTGAGRIIEVQGSAEGDPFEESQFIQMLDLAKKGIQEIVSLQKKILVQDALKSKLESK